MPLHRRPYLHGLLLALRRAGIAQGVLCTSRFSRLVRLYAGSGGKYGLSLGYSHDPGTIENAGALLWALPGIRTPLILCVNGDTIVDLDIEAFLDFHLASGATASLVASTRWDQPHPGAVEVMPSGFVRDIHEVSQDCGSVYSVHPQSRGFANSGVYAFDAARLRREWQSALRPGKIEQGLLRNLAWRRELRAYVNEDRYLLDIGTPAGLEKAQGELETIGRFFEL